ncbi:hypothetical protein J9B83_01390 [Marinomonas sp. A79]|uniref:Oligosaccharide biosynthesis protein Alg14 like protein n=1 Tax=Marinomonas vulgaris TaxID=2823372 RepID=A0ABS5H795_9GAMM|nr:hypothetical protein [Marinomonas vulgaris]MBR7887576.1 hypothetical protein [Marinomonas vulgaris]
MDASKKFIGVSSSGGHLIQLLAIEKNIDYNFSHIITTVELKHDADNYKSIKVMDCNVNQPIRLMICFYMLVKAIYSIKPTCIISTGAAPGGLALVIGKLFRCKTIWIDSIANTKKASLTGRLVKPFCDVWVSQWEAVALENKGEYIGKSINIFNSR